MITLSAGTSWWKRERTSQIFRGSYDGPQLLAAPRNGVKQTTSHGGKQRTINGHEDDIPTEDIFENSEKIGKVATHRETSRMAQ